METLKQITGIINDISSVLFRLAITFMLFASYDTIHSIADYLLSVL